MPREKSPGKNSNRSNGTSQRKQGTRGSSRREFLKSFAAISAFEALIGCKGGYFASEEAQPAQRDTDFIPDAELQLTPKETLVSILPGQPTRVLKYDAAVLKGDLEILEKNPHTYLGPIIRARRGQKLRIHLKNELREPTIIHWHGLHVPPEMDGHPRYAIPQEKSYVYEFKVSNRAGTYWFHPHPHQRTGFQVYAGLAGMFIVSDEEESALHLPRGEFDVPLVIQDRSFDAANQLVYMTSPMDQMGGFLGDRILVNGQPDFKLSAVAGTYRFRVLNGSNARLYKLAWEDGAPLVVIATDGGLIRKAVQRDYVLLGPGERIELWADFSNRRVGTELRLKSLAFAGAESGMMGMIGRGMMMGGMMRSGNRSLPQGAEFTILRVKIDHETKETVSLPDQLTKMERLTLEDAINRQYPRRFEIAMAGMMGWIINGRAFEMDGVASDETVKLNTLEAWQFINQSVGMMGGMAHPMHIHGVQFQILRRQIQPQFEDVWKTVRAGYVDDGWKDTVILWPGERITLLTKFSDFPGLFMYHCHNLEHEDQGLMRNYLIQA